VTPQPSATSAAEYVDAGRDLVVQGQPEQALEAFAKAIELDPEYAPAFHYRGEVYYDGGQYDLAVNDWTRVIELDPTWTEGLAYNNRADAYGALGKHDLAVADLTKALEIKPEAAATYAQRGYANHQLHEYDLAVADYTKAIDLGLPESLLGGVYWWRCSAYGGQEKWELVVSDCTAAVERDPTNALAFALRAMAKAYRDDTAGATADFDQALSLTTDPDLTRYIKEMQSSVGLGD
jgi:tetratricopeptide (TPR) repeat protein